ncbi:MAG: phosphoenolpyruvate--protein phosphotransferase, partial [Firmicutes bacterium]|nr:phosphoenolpyruvate--protein phosphotransferase [Bacillota bacterium]
NLEDFSIDSSKKKITDIDLEIKKFDEAIEKTKEQLSNLYMLAEKKFGIETARIFESHLLITEDPEIKGAVHQKIRNESVNLSYALKTVVTGFMDLFQALDDDYLKERAVDLLDVYKRILKNAFDIQIVDLAAVQHQVILLAHELTPSETAQIDPKYVLGFATETGGKTSHSAIIARLLGVPALVGAKDIMTKFENGQEIILDGILGEIIDDFDDEIKSLYIKKEKAFDLANQALEKMKGVLSTTLDGHPITLAGNIGSSKDLNHILNHDADGIGLYRTEFLYLDHQTFPTEDEQFNDYKNVLEKMNPKPVVIRTLDIGGDKNLPYLKMANEMNPFLGKRAIRLSLDEKELFRTQLRALIRASAYGNLKIMFPMIATLGEFLEAKEIVESIKKELDSNNIKYNDFELGIMIEIPSAALMADSLAKHVDFFSIGTNDLIQYTMAADRMNESVGYLYQPFNPAILKLIQMVTTAAKKNKIWTSVCGEMGGDLNAGPILIGLGVTELSMTPTQILKMRRVISTMNYSDLQQIALNVLELESEEEVLLELKKSIHI